MSLIVGQFTVSAQERVVFGVPCADAVLAEVERVDARRCFVVSTRSLTALQAGPLQRIERALGDRLAGAFAAIRAHSPRADVVAAAEAARAARADLLIAVGGGSVIDACKAAQLCLWHDLRTAEAMEPFRKRQPIEPPRDAIRMVSVSTTLSASEFTANAGVTDSASNAKQSFTHRLFTPRVAILDPAATLNTPEWLLYCTGIRAVDHAVESYCSLQANPATEANSLQGLRLLSQALPATKANPQDLSARQQAQFGMWQSIVASTAGVPMGASHGIGYALGASYNVAHGHTSCVMLPAVLQWNSRTNADRQRALAHAMGDPNRDAAVLVRDLVGTLEQPTALRDVGIKREQLDAIAAQALHYGPVKNNPRTIASVADVREILELAF